MTVQLNCKTLSQLKSYIKSKLGLEIWENDETRIASILEGRLQKTHTDNWESYLALLQSTTKQSRKEWALIVSLLANGETYFFRDKQQMSMLKNWILPELIARNRDDRKLRIWSAGCSSGEEPYTIAMLLDGMLPDLDDWKVSILGTDLNPEAIQKARKAHYRDWSFRMTPDHLQEKYFCVKNEPLGHRKYWSLDDRIARMVQFRILNFVTDHFPDGDVINDMDLIICRNVFIYFDKDTIAKVSQKLIRTLRNESFLVAGNGELTGQNVHEGMLRMFPDGVAYQRMAEAPANYNQPVQIVAKRQLTPVLEDGVDREVASYKARFIPNTPDVDTSLTATTLVKEEQAAYQHCLEARQLLSAGDHNGATNKLRKLLKRNPRHYDGHLLIGEALANLGQYEKAMSHCHQAVTIKPMASGADYLLSKLYELQGNSDKAIGHLKKAITLNPSLVSARLELASLYETLKDDAKATGERIRVLNYLKAMAPDAPIEPYPGITATDLIRYLDSILGSAVNEGARGKLTRDRASVAPKKHIGAVTPSRTPAVSVSYLDSPHDKILNAAKTAFDAKDYPCALRNAQELLQQDSRHFDATYLMARVYANQGQSEKAIALCHQLMEIAPMSSAPHQLLATIYDEEGNVAKALTQLRKSIYLEPDVLATYLQAAVLYERDQNDKHAQKMYQTAWNFLQQTPQSSSDDLYGGITPEDLAQKVGHGMSDRGKPSR